MAARKAAHHAQPARMNRTAPRPAQGGRRPKLRQGFTLVEIAVVIGIIALIIGALLPLIAAQSANTRINATRSHEESIRTALTGFLGQHGYLPCPADGFALPGSAGYGHEARATINVGTGPCALASASGNVVSSLSTTVANASINQVTTFRGVVPWLDLGLPEDVVNDAWNQRITYVTTNTATQPFATRDAGSGMVGGLLVCNGLGNTALLLAPAVTGSTACNDPASALAVPGTQSPVLALISHGENGFGAFIAPQGPTAPASGMVRPYSSASAAERANIELGTHVLVQGSYSRTNDDLVLWVTAADLTAPLIRSNALMAPQAQVMQKFQQMRGQILAAMVNKRTSVIDSSTCQSAYAYTLTLDTPCQGATLFCQHPLYSPAPLLAQALPARTDPAITLTWAFALDANGSTGTAAINATSRFTDDASRTSFDPWGNPVLFGLLGAGGNTIIFSATEPAGNSATPYAFMLYSAGPDGVFGTSDDQSLLVSNSEVQAALTSYGPLAASSQSSGTTTCAH